MTATVEDISDALRVILALKASHVTLTAAEIAGVTGLPHDRVSLALRAAERAGITMRLPRRPGRLSTRWTSTELSWL
ncbi:hypothetical protein [Rhodococcus sp. BH4]|uniref:hypothetical protein n=1 Tax=Rhodococcus sp. BH4 TaxID=1807790 RepID=UPI0012EB1C2E|nr:hypothetical protein [Rhodococcus sp. BH4]